MQTIYHTIHPTQEPKAFICPLVTDLDIASLKPRCVCSHSCDLAVETIVKIIDTYWHYCDALNKKQTSFFICKIFHEQHREI